MNTMVNQPAALATIGDKIVETLYSNPQSASLPSPFHSKLWSLLFSIGSSNSGPTLHRGDWGGKVIVFLPKKAQFRAKCLNPFCRLMFSKKSEKWGVKSPIWLDACADYDLNLGKPRSKTNPYLMVKAELESGTSRLLVRERRAKEDARSRILYREMILGKHHAPTADVYLSSPTSVFVF